MELEILQTRPRMRYAYDELKGMAEQFGPNAQLPTMVQLRQSLGVSMHTLHAALRELEEQRILRSVHGVGIFVREQRLTGNIGVLIHSRILESNPNIQSMLAGIRDGCREQERKIMLIEDDSAFDPDQVDGILYSGDSREFYALGISAHVPQVILLQHVKGITAVTADDFGGFKLATSHLIRRGHSRIACLTEELESILLPLRREGYQAALRDAGIVPQPGWLRSSLRRGVDYLEWGYRSMSDWLNKEWEELNCTAVVAQNDYTAIGVMRALQEVGIDVPGQISVMGFDGTIACDIAQPRLTSIEVPLHRIGYEAVKVLCEQIQNSSRTPREVLLPVKLRKGGSVLSIHAKGD